MPSIQLSVTLFFFVVVVSSWSAMGQNTRFQDLLVADGDFESQNDKSWSFSNSNPNNYKFFSFDTTEAINGTSLRVRNVTQADHDSVNMHFTSTSTVYIPTNTKSIWIQFRYKVIKGWTLITSPSKLPFVSCGFQGVGSGMLENCSIFNLFLDIVQHIQRNALYSTIVGSLIL